ncbi:MAG: hypothetical protein HW410_1123 [Nitrosarchaeum sp.]|nr:hypothetical protein [Nitrosarchaeum sp.]
MIGNGAENNLTWRTMMAKPEISRERMKNADPCGAKPNRTIRSCTEFR